MVSPPSLHLYNSHGGDTVDTLTGILSIVAYFTAMTARKILLSSLLLSLSTLLFGQVPSDLSGLRIWLDAQEGDSITQAGGTVSAWGNKADGANPATQVNADEQPTYSADGLNDLPALYFDGTSDNMIFANDIRTEAGEFHMFLVGSGETGGNSWARIAASWSGSGDPWAAPNWLLWAPNESGVVQAFDPEIKTASGTKQVLQNISIGSDAANTQINHFKGYIGEVLIYDRQLNAEEQNDIFSYLNQRWGFPEASYEPPENVSLEPRLRDLGDALGVTIGSITRDNFYDFPETELYQKTLGEQFGILTTGNAAKFGPLSTGQGTYDFSTLDRHLEFAETYDMQFHGHVFIWHSQTPNWLQNGTWTREQLIEILNDHITQVGTYLKGKVVLWDVVNEPWLGDGSWRSPSIWNDVIDAENTASDQRDFIDLAFQKAREIDPDAELILNDFSVATINDKSDAMYAWAQSMVNRGIPLDGVGFQMHLTGAINYDSFAQNMQRFADLGLNIHVTELDVRVPIPFSTQKAIDQADVYRQVIRKVLDQPAVKTFTMWGFTDAHSWIPTHFPGTDNALIFDTEYRPKHAFVALQEELMARLTTAAWQNVLAPGSDLNLDLDNDGFSTFLEIALDLDPQTPNPRLEMPVQLAPGLVTIGFTPRSMTTDIELLVETSTDLETWETAVRRQAGFTEWDLIRQDTSILIDDKTGKTHVSLENFEPGNYARFRAVQTD